MLFVPERRRSKRAEQSVRARATLRKLGRVLSQESLWRMRPGASVFLSVLDI
jgi:hypothetical protein